MQILLQVPVVMLFVPAGIFKTPHYSVASWFCWGTTHFCDECHTKQGTPKT